MKYIISTLLMLCSLTAFAGGKLAVEPRYYLNEKQIGGTVSMSIYQPIPFLILDSWFGTGRSIDNSGELENWFRGKVDLKRQIKPEITVGLGVGADAIYSPGKFAPDGHVVFEYKLW